MCVMYVVYVCVCGGMCMIYAHVLYASICTHLLMKAPGRCWCFPLSLSVLFLWDMASHWTWSLLFQLQWWLASPSHSPVSVPPACDYRYLWAFLAFDVSTGYWTQVLRLVQQELLPSKQFSQLQNFAFLVCPWMVLILWIHGPPLSTKGFFCAEWKHILTISLLLMSLSKKVISVL